MTIPEFFARLKENGADKIILSKAVKGELYKKIVAEKKSGYYQIACYTEKQVFHENVPENAAADHCADLMAGRFLQANGWSAEGEHILLVSKKGACTAKLKKMAAAVPAAEQGHDRKKTYILEEGTVVPPLVDMGVFTPDGRVVKAMYDKYRQINRFLEILDDGIGGLKTDTLNLIDFGCGKSYLTFVIYHYLTAIKGMRANIIGLDLKKDVVEKCAAAAKKYGYDGLRFELGDINGYKAPFDVDVVVTLHACDTATDFALYNAVQWGAKMIFSVPCCQHELNGQMVPETLGILSRYGIIKERFAALATDAIRGNLLEYSGYKTQLLEFIDFEHTPKNILIRAVKRPTTPKETKVKALGEVEALQKEFGFTPALYRLLVEKEK